MSSATPPPFTETQGQYLAFIYTYVLLYRQAPAETDFQRFFCVTPPSVHSMIKQLERLGFIRRTPRQARSICDADVVDWPAPKSWTVPARKLAQSVPRLLVTGVAP